MKSTKTIREHIGCECDELFDSYWLDPDELILPPRLFMDINKPAKIIETINEVLWSKRY